MNEPHDPSDPKDPLPAAPGSDPVGPVGPVDSVGRFESALADWGRRPPSTPPAIAMRRLSRLLTDRPVGGASAEAAGSSPKGLALARLMAAAAVVILAVGIWLLLPAVPVPPQRAPEALGQRAGELAGAQPVPAAVAAPVVDDSVLILYLDADTPLYLTLVPPRAGKGDPS